MGNSIRQNIRATYKSEDTEETIDIYFYRPLGYFWAVISKKAGITPNMITIASIFIGIAAGILFYYPDLKLNILGMLLLVLANSFDSADGQLARMTNNKTQLGRILDGLAGDLWFIVIYIVLVLKCINQGWNYSIWIIASLAGASHILHAAIADYYRNIHLYFVKGNSGSEHHNSKSLLSEYQKLSWKKDFINKLMMFFYKNYTKQQETLTPKFQQFISKLLSVYPNQDYPQELRNDFVSFSKPLMKYTNILQFNTRVLFLFFCLIINKPFYYFLFDLIVLNSILIYLIYKHETNCKRLTINITN